MDGSTTRRLTSDNKDSLIQDFVVKKYSCMYTPDLQKHKKVWHDGFVKLHHKNSKIYLISEDGHPLAERFLKVSSVRISRCLPNSDRGENSKNSASSSPGSTSTAQFQQQLPDGFEMFEDEEIDFDGIEDSEARNLAYLARIEKLDKIEKESVTKVGKWTYQDQVDLQKKKREFLDEQIQIYSSKKAKKTFPSNSTSNDQISSKKDTQINHQTTQADLSSPMTKPLNGNLTKYNNRLSSSFETRPFTSPLMKTNKAFATMAKRPIIEPLEEDHKNRFIKPDELFDNEEEIKVVSNKTDHSSDVQEQPSERVREGEDMKGSSTRVDMNPSAPSNDKVLTRRGLNIDWKSFCKNKK